MLASITLISAYFEVMRSISEATSSSSIPSNRSRPNTCTAFRSSRSQVSASIMSVFVMIPIGSSVLSAVTTSEGCAT